MERKGKGRDEAEVRPAANGIFVSRSTPAVSIERFFELSLLGLVTSGYLAVLGSGYLDAPTAVAVAVGLVLRGLLVAGFLRLRLSSRLIAALTIAYIGFYPLDYLFLSGEFLPATVHLVFFLAVLKILTAAATRDYVFVAIIAFLELLAASILSTNLNFFVFLALFLLFGVATFASSEIRRSIRRPRNIARAGLRHFHWRLAGMTLAVALGILSLTGGLFFLLPRTAQAAFQRLVPQRYHIPGFSNEMVLGEIGEIQKRTTSVMHVRFFSAEAPAHLKWRGVALSQFDGKRWYNPPEPGRVMRVRELRENLIRLADNRQQWREGRRINYEVRLSAMASDALFFAGTPEFVRIDLPAVIRTSTDSYRLAFGNSDGLHYGAYSFLEETAQVNDPYLPVLPQAQRIEYLLLPKTDPRVIDLARDITRGLQTDEERTRAVEFYLRRNYRYTTELPSRELPDPLAHFLLERRKGHCEYFASAMAVMLRILHIPARVATGFQSGIYNPVSGWYVIRALDAHSWVEAHLPGRGWTTFDPTPPDPNPPRLSLWSRIGFYLDAAETFWQEWVLNYDLNRQLTLASRMEDSSRTFGSRWMDLLRSRISGAKSVLAAWAKRYGVPALLVVLAAVAGVLFGPGVWAWWKTLARVRQVQRGEARASDATLLYRRMLSLLKRRGFAKPACLTPAEFASRLPACEAARLVAEFTFAYNDLRFGGKREAASRMVALLERLEEAGDFSPLRATNT